MQPQGYKDCPHCNRPTAVDSPVCSGCGHIYGSAPQPYGAHAGPAPGQAPSPQPYGQPYGAPTYQPPPSHPPYGTQQHYHQHVHQHAYPAGEKSKIAAALFAFFLGGLGIHGFYLGNVGMGLFYLIGSLISWPLVCIWIGIIPLSIMSLMILIQFILYLATPDAEFHQKYVVEKRWF